MHDLKVEIVGPDRLEAADLALWTQWVAQNPGLTGPYFDPLYVCSIGATVPGAAVARIMAADDVIAFLPFQKRGGVIQPLGAPLTDFHGLICAPGSEIDLPAVLRRIGGRRLEFNGWVNGAGVEGQTRQRLYADLSSGFGAYYRQCYDAHRKVYRNIERCRRNMERDLPDLAFSWERTTPQLIDWVIGHKRQQFHRTALHDVFTCGWTRDLLVRLSEDTTDGFGLMAGVYRRGDTVIAAEIALRSGDSLHLWLPAYEADYGRYGPGIALSLDILKAASADGIVRVDFGCGDETYKATMTTHAEPCVEGRVVTRPSIALPYPAARAIGARLAIIRACETRAEGQVRAVWHLGRRLMKRARTATVAFLGILGLTGAALIAEML